VIVLPAHFFCSIHGTEEHSQKKPPAIVGAVNYYAPAPPYAGALSDDAV